MKKSLRGGGDFLQLRGIKFTLTSHTSTFRFYKEFYSNKNPRKRLIDSIVKQCAEIEYFAQINSYLNNSKTFLWYSFILFLDCNTFLFYRSNILLNLF